MSAQEASWFLLRQPLSKASRDIIFIPTQLPDNRPRNRKSTNQMDSEGIDENSTNVWTKNIIEKYEERSSELSSIYLAEYCAYYNLTRSKSNDPDGEDGIGDVIDDLSQDTTENVHEKTGKPKVPNHLKRRTVARIIRYVKYSPEDLDNFKREMVLLYIPFQNELSDIIDRNKFINIYDENEELIMERRKLFEDNIDIEAVIAEIKALGNFQETELAEDPPSDQERPRIGIEAEENNDDIEHIAVNNNLLTAVGRRSNVMSKAQYCDLMRSANREQKELLLEAIHRIHSPDSPPIQAFLTGPAGCGKTYTINLLKETFNRFTKNHNSHRNSFIACASTGNKSII